MRPDRELEHRAAKHAVSVVFVVNGLLFASWVARLPELRSALDLSLGQVGLLLVCLSLGTLVALPSSGPVVAHVGPARTVAGGAILTAVGLVGLGVGALTATVWVAALALFTYGVGTSSWDVAMNVEGAEVERRLGRTVMPRFHAGFSIGTVLGAAAGALAAWWGVGLPAQLAATAAFGLYGAVAGARRFLVPVTPDPVAPRQRSRDTLSAWKEPRTLALGVMVFGFALCEGIASDWLAIALVDGYAVSPAVAAGGYAVFVAAMTTGRMTGGSLTERWGRVAVLRASGLLVLVGATIVVLAPAVPVALVGAVLWGLGTSLGFPLGMTAAGEDPQRSAARVAVVSSIGYLAFFGGPPLVGAVGDAVGVQNALLLVLAAATLGFASARAASSEGHRAATSVPSSAA